MKKCRHCKHEIRKVKGKYLHRKEHSKYSGVGGSGGVTFTKVCGIMDWLLLTRCKCDNPEP